MWRSEEDIIKDLATLNDFGIPGDQEPYKFLSSIGRGGSKVKKINSEAFVDPRTGDVINVKDLETPDLLYKSKGRGSLLSSFSKSTLQLQQQLRLARPSGSSDEAVESYYRRNRPVEKPKPQTNRDYSGCENINCNTASGNPKADSNAVESRLRVKGVRHSTSQGNALISNLLAKAKENSNGGLISDNCCSSDSDSNIDFNTDRFNKFKDQKSLINGFDFPNVSTINQRHEEQDFLDNTCSTCDQCTKKENVTVEDFEGICNERKEEVEEKKEGKISNEDCLTGGIRKKEMLKENCIKCSRKLNKLIENNSEVDGEEIYDFSDFSESLTSPESKSINEFEVFNNSVKTSFLYNKNDFPVLRKLKN